MSNANDKLFDLAEDKVSEAMTQLIRDNSFYACGLLNMKREISLQLPTAAVAFGHGSITMLINPHFIMQFTTKEAGAILVHEFSHILFEHFTRFDEEFKHPGLRDIANIATDMAINQYINDLPKTFKIFDKEGKEIEFKDKKGNVQPGKPVLPETYKMPKELTSEGYYNLLIEKAKEQMSKGQGKLGEGYQGLDEHNAGALDGNDESLGNEHKGEIIKELIKKSVNDLEDLKSMNQARGTIPNHIQEMINKILKSQTNNWKKDLRKFVARTSEIVIDSSRKRRHRRYGITQPGEHKEPKLSLACVIDSSGSVSDRALQQVMAELHSIWLNNVKITYIVCDAAVHEVAEYKGQKAVKISGRGGTAMAPAFDACKKLDVDAIFCFTDGYTDQPAKPNVPVLWCIEGDAANPTTYGKVTRIKVDAKNV